MTRNIFAATLVFLALAGTSFAQAPSRPTPEQAAAILLRSQSDRNIANWPTWTGQEATAHVIPSRPNTRIEWSPEAQRRDMLREFMRLLPVSYTNDAWGYGGQAQGQAQAQSQGVQVYLPSTTPTVAAPRPASPITHGLPAGPAPATPVDGDALARQRMREAQAHQQTINEQVREREAQRARDAFDSGFGRCGALVPESCSSSTGR